ncbi:MAG: hypothetical protein JW759_02855 [Candidatus Coatesbacteria bacterium]|nr:hypothetical protein [Candidatus Coatesbacteria bacterium]
MMRKRYLLAVFLLIAVWTAHSISQANWFAEQNNRDGLSLLADGNYDEAAKAFKAAILVYESSNSLKYSLDRAPLYFNLAQAYFFKMNRFPLLSRGYEYYWRMGLLSAQEAVKIQYGDPMVNSYYNARPTELFDVGLEAGSKKVRDFLKMRNLVRKFEGARKMAMFQKCVNVGPIPSSNILTIGPSEFSAGEIRTPAGRKASQPSTAPGQEKSRESGGSSPALEQAQEIGEGTAKSNR